MLQSRPVTPPRQQRREQPPVAQEDTGALVGCLERPDGSELRVSLAEFKGHPFVRIQLFRPDANGDAKMWPTARLVTVKIRELAEFRDAITAAMERVGAAEDAYAVDDLPAELGARR